MDVTWQMLIIVCPLAFLAGFVDSVAGGGGLISLPAYYLAGLPPVLAAGTNKLSAALGTLTASARFISGGWVQLRVAVLAALGAFPGSWLGTTLLQHIPEDAVRMMMIAAITGRMVNSSLAICCSMLRLACWFFPVIVSTSCSHYSTIYGLSD